MALEGGQGSASRPGRSLPPGKSRYPSYRRLDGPQGWSGQVRKISPPTGIRSSDRPACSQLLCQLSYLAHNGQVGSDIWKDRSVFIFRVISPRCLYPWIAVPCGQKVRKYLPDITAWRARRLASSLTQLHEPRALQCRGHLMRYADACHMRCHWRLWNLHRYVMDTNFSITYRYYNASCRFVCYIRIFYCNLKWMPNL